LLAVILSREEHGYKLGTKSGVLRGLYTRNQFELSEPANYVDNHRDGEKNIFFDFNLG
jgi:hypothetical protein